MRAKRTASGSALRAAVNFNSVPMEPEHRFSLFTFYDRNICIHDRSDPSAIGLGLPDDNLDVSSLTAV